MGAIGSRHFETHSVTCSHFTPPLSGMRPSGDKEWHGESVEPRAETLQYLAVMRHLAQQLV